MTTTANPTNAPARPWSPSNRDTLIYRWVKFEGRSQAWAAAEMSLNQSTVSRIINRYERWIAHGGPSQNGGLNRQERLRAQHYLTIERNEWILASCFRLAATMEHFSDTSRSTTTHHCSEPSRELEVRTQHSVLDRTGKVCRYLRLAHRVNMDQKKLVKEEDLPDLEPLTLDPNEYSQAAADARDGFQLDTPFQRAPADEPQPPCSQAPVWEHPNPRLPPRPSDAPSPASNGSSTDLPPESSVLRTMPTTHNAPTQELPLTSDSPITSVEAAPSKNSHSPAYAVAQQPPERTDPPTDRLAAPLPEPPAIIRLSLPFYIPLTS